MIPSGQTAYTARYPYPSLLVRAKDTRVQMPIYRDGALVAPISGTYTLLAPGGATVLTHAITVASSVATYTIPAASLPASLVLGEGYMEVWSLLLTGESSSIEIRHTAALGLCPLYPVVTDADLIGEYDGISAYYAGSLTSFQGPIDQAWKKIVSDLIEDGRLAYMVRTPDALREAHLHLSLAKLFQGFGLNADGAHWRELAKVEHQRYESAWSRATLQLDQAGTGLVDNALARAAASGPVAFNSSQPAGFRRGLYSRFGL